MWINKFTRLEIFRKTWKVLEKQSFCDGWGGAECRRIRAEYIDSEYPLNVAKFIVARANDCPEDYDECSKCSTGPGREIREDLAADKAKRIEILKQKMLEARKPKENPQ